MRWRNSARLVEVQGGDPSYVDHPEKLPKAKIIEVIPAPQSGYLQEINARVVGEMAVVLGAGRLKKGHPVNHAVGIVVHHKVGNKVEDGEPLFTIHADTQATLDEVKPELLAAHVWSDQPVEPLPLFYGVVTDQE